MSNIAKFENSINNYEEKRDLVRRTFGKGLTNDEFDLFLHVCHHTSLDPTTKQIYAVKRKDTMTIQVGIDGLRSIAERTGNYSPGKEPSYQYDDKGNIISATAYVKKRTPDGTWHEVSATAFFNEYKPSYGGAFWTDKPHLMIAKCAESLVIRKAFPSVTANLYATEEMDRADPIIDTNTLMEPKIDYMPNKGHSDAFTQESPLEQIRTYLESEGIASDRLEEWVKLRCQTKNESPESILKACIGREILPKFKRAFINWLSTAENSYKAV